ncbi:hypothetical protein H1Q63_16570 [Desmonostoc muscorum CCALA 125]|nr:hypothetical protein [Desmonostoc muscorum CCALA 125]
MNYANALTLPQQATTFAISATTFAILATTFAILAIAVTSLIGLYQNNGQIH